MICAAQYSQDKMWYRARILDILGGRRLLVQYVDYGNTEIIHHTKIRKILDDDIKFPEQVKSDVIFVLLCSFVNFAVFCLNRHLSLPCPSLIPLPKCYFKRHRLHFF